MLFSSLAWLGVQRYLAAVPRYELVMCQVLFTTGIDDHALVAAAEEQGWVRAISEPTEKLPRIGKSGDPAIRQARAKYCVPQGYGYGVIHNIAVTRPVQWRNFVQVLRRQFAFLSVHFTLQYTRWLISYCENQAPAL
jgi:hypothetical protein